jgi:hypothetical protein
MMIENKLTKKIDIGISLAPAKDVKSAPKKHIGF